MLFCFTLTGPITVMYFGAGIAQLVERLTEKPGLNTDEGSSPRCGKDFFSSQSQLPVQTLLRSPYSPRVESSAPTFVRTLKISNNGSHTIVWTQENTTHTDRNG